MRRVVIIGGSGSGKSTLARKIGKAANLPVIHLDKFFFNPGWVERERADFNKDVQAQTQKSKWVMDGNFISSLPARLARADTLVFLDIPSHVRLWRVIKRMLQTYGKVRLDMAPRCPEGFDLDFLQWVIGYDKRGDRSVALQSLASAPDHILAVHLKSGAEVDEFLKTIEMK